jgi:hypothetical protein
MGVYEIFIILEDGVKGVHASSAIMELVSLLLNFKRELKSCGVKLPRQTGSPPPENFQILRSQTNEWQTSEGTSLPGQ